ncbi:HalOD1 output domain-containing protein [Natrialba swarupiae]|uniref:HalOD1 output domain-containing protein n=1 Tax=Natrialba swarupiae TaxID=2448032 RepID=UPI001390CEA6|nr:HalOD1 output domain-containing protein [Natrialba swarupiae]
MNTNQRIADEHSPTGVEGNDCEPFVHQGEPDRPLSEAVTVAVAEKTGLDDPLAVASEFGPLYDAVDPAALDALFEPTSTGNRSAGTITFTYAGHDIEVDTSGRVRLSRLE